MGGFRRIIFLILFLAFVPFLAINGQAQTDQQEFFPETGHWVAGEFLAYYHSADDPLAVFGYPITREFTDPTTNRRVQYFQRARFDLELTPTGTTVTSAPLGSLLYVSGENMVSDVGHDVALCRTFFNGKEVCYAFLQYYEANQGYQFLGAPISATEINEAGFLVQYFEKGMLEWHPELAPGMRVRLADLGRIYFDEFVGNPAYTRPDGDNIPSRTELIPSVKVFTSQAIITANSTQELYVIVTDQFQRPISGALVGVTISLPDGQENFFRLPETDESGISTLQLWIGELAPRDIIQIQAVASTGGDPVNSSTWFRIWW